MIDVLDELADASLEAHTSIVLAYNVDLLVYDKLIRRRLASAGVMSQVVFCDGTPYAAALEGVDAVSRLGRAYSVTPVRVQGAFHPKAYLLLGRRSGMLVLGSGNASLGGLVRNAEVFGRFVYKQDGDSGPHPAFAQVFRLAKHLSRRATPAVRAQLERAQHWTPWLSDQPVPDGRTVWLGGPEQPPLIDAIERPTEKSPVRRITAVTSSFDRKLDGVRALARIGSADHETKIVVQPGRLVIDGAAVRRLGADVQWHEFVDPRPSKKKEPRDSYLHAKIVLVETEAADHLFFGSANISRPALLTGENVEVLVELPLAPPGTWLDQLGLEDSLESDARASLLARTWDDASDPDTEDRSSVHLAGVEWSPGVGWVVVADVDASVRLVLGRRRAHPEQVLVLRLQSDGSALASASTPLEGVRFAWLIDRAGSTISGAVAITWPDVARARLSGWFGARVEQALLSMKHGELLGHVLFEFLDRVPDLGVLAIAQLRQAHGSRKDDEPGGADAPRTEESFYTDARRSDAELGHLALGDRSDLDLLASLVQPLQRPGAAHQEEDDDEDDEGIEEEAERRGLDASRAGDGSERGASSRVPSAKRMRAAGRRFSRRVERAATALGEMLDAIDDEIVLPPGLVARQVWMTFIAGFVAGRPVDTSDEGEQVVVEPDVFAHYVLRCAGWLAGDARGGLLRRIDAASWSTKDGVALADGLKFFAASCAWATAWFEAAYETSVSAWTARDEPLYSDGIHDAIPVFVLARLLVAGNAHIAEPDFEDAARRISAWSEVSPDAVHSAARRAKILARWLGRIDQAEDPRALAEPAVGAAVRLRKSGVGVVIAQHHDVVRVAMLGRPRRPVVPFKASAAQALAFPAEVGRVLIADVSPEVTGT